MAKRLDRCCTGVAMFATTVIFWCFLAGACEQSPPMTPAAKDGTREDTGFRLSITSVARTETGEVEVRCKLERLPKTRELFKGIEKATFKFFDAEGQRMKPDASENVFLPKDFITYKTDTVELGFLIESPPEATSVTVQVVGVQSEKAAIPKKGKEK
jgi:hypothetical protein